MMCSNKCILPFFGRCQEASTDEEHLERAEGNLTWKKKEKKGKHFITHYGIKRPRKETYKQLFFPCSLDRPVSNNSCRVTSNCEPLLCSEPVYFPKKCGKKSGTTTTCIFP